MDSEFENAFANGSVIAKISGFELPHPVEDSRLRLLVTQTGKPFVERTSSFVSRVEDDLDHEVIVA
jgi:hypothetical protein